MVTKETELKEAPITRETPDSIRQPAWHVAVIGFFSFGLYLFYWFYKTWRDLRNHAQAQYGDNPDLNDENASTLRKYMNIKPWLRSLVFFIPVFCIPLGFTPLRATCEVALRYIMPVALVIMIANLFKDIASLIPNKDSWAKTNPIQAGFVMTMLIPVCLVLAGAKGFVYLAYLSVVIPIAVVQNWLNQYWESVEEGPRALRNAFSLWETIVIILGALWMGLVVLDLIQVK